MADDEELKEKIARKDRNTVVACAASLLTVEHVSRDVSGHCTRIMWGEGCCSAWDGFSQRDRQTDGHRDGSSVGQQHVTACGVCKPFPVSPFMAALFELRCKSVLHFLFRLRDPNGEVVDVKTEDLPLEYFQLLKRITFVTIGPRFSLKLRL